MKFIFYKNGNYEKALVINDDPWVCINAISCHDIKMIDSLDLFLYGNDYLRKWSFPENWKDIPKNELVMHIAHCAHMHEVFYSE